MQRSFRHDKALLVPLALALSISAAQTSAAVLVGQTTFGGAGNESGTGIAATSSGIYFSGDSAGTQAIAGQYANSLGGAPLWSRVSPLIPNGEFNFGVATVGSSVYTVGGSYSQTVDTVGGKERKGLTAAYNADGTSGGAFNGAVWTQQTPAAPGGFPYGGIEWLTGISVGSESGQDFLYTAGIGERFGFTTLWGTVVSKLDATGNVLWARNDSTPTHFVVNGSLHTPAVAATNDGVIMATRNDSDSGAGLPYLKRYDASGNLLWSRVSSTQGEYRGVATANGAFYAVGQTAPGSSTSDFLIESWDGAGNLLWSKTYDRNSSEDALNGAILIGGHLYAVGATRGNTSGGSDGILLDIDALTGSLLDSTLWGGAADDSLAGISYDGSLLFAVGSTNSFGAGGSDIAIASFANLAEVPAPTTIVLFTLGGIVLVLRQVSALSRPSPR